MFKLNTLPPSTPLIGSFHPTPQPQRCGGECGIAGEFLVCPRLQVEGGMRDFWGLQ
ncbi:MAG: hypothetical protein IJZ19_16390 [Lentisphaeria bacterium]|nr:hypothetical protein [Lentisphaeria bacterium]